MGQTDKYTEPTIWALRKNTRQVREATNSLYEHLYGYEPILVPRPADDVETVRKGSAENPGLNILNSNTNFLVKAIISAKHN